jgi:hypothetical protein
MSKTQRYSAAGRIGLIEKSTDLIYNNIQHIFSSYSLSYHLFRIFMQSHELVWTLHYHCQVIVMIAVNFHCVIRWYYVAREGFTSAKCIVLTSFWYLTKLLVTAHVVTIETRVIKA